MRPFFWDLFCSPFFDVLSYKTGIAIYDLRIRDQVPNFTSLFSVVAQLPQLEMSRPKKFYIINGFAKCAVLDFHVICVVSIFLNVYTAGPLLVREMRVEGLRSLLYLLELQYRNILKNFNWVVEQQVASHQIYGNCTICRFGFLTKYSHCKDCAN